MEQKLPLKWTCVEVEEKADITAMVSWEMHNATGMKWPSYYEYKVSRICGNPSCINPRHVYPSINLDHLFNAGVRLKKEASSVEPNKQLFYRQVRNEILTLMATLNDIERARINQMDDAEAEKHILKLREDRRAMSTTNRVAKKVGTKKVSKKSMIQGQSLEKQLEGMSLEDLQELSEKLKGKMG